MARIPVEKEGGSPWWLWLLGLLLLIGLIWLLIEAFDTEPVEEPIAEVPAPVEPPAGAVIRDLSTITTASNAADFFGRELQINNLYVTEVLSDRVFMVCSAEAATPGQPVSASACTTEEVPVVLDENVGAGPTPPPGNQVEGAVNVNPGQRVSITDGQVAEFVQTQAQAWGLDQMEVDQLAQREFYIEANSVNITQDAGTAAQAPTGERG